VQEQMGCLVKEREPEPLRRVPNCP
jgi:hypothetical protein